MAGRPLSLAHNMSGDFSEWSVRITAAELVGISERQIRRWRKRLEEQGPRGLLDRRRRKPSSRRVPNAQAEEEESDRHATRFRDFRALCVLSSPRASHFLVRIASHSAANCTCPHNSLDHRHCRSLLCSSAGGEIVISHPRFYWGETGNSGTPPLFKIPIPASRDTVPTGYNYVMPDQNGWSRYLHFEAAWAWCSPGSSTSWRACSTPLPQQPAPLARRPELAVHSGR